jgi:hypothetical protein
VWEEVIISLELRLQFLPRSVERRRLIAGVYFFLIASTVRHRVVSISATGNYPHLG